MSKSKSRHLVTRKARHVLNQAMENCPKQMSMKRSVNNHYGVGLNISDFREKVPQDSEETTNILDDFYYYK